MLVAAAFCPPPPLLVPELAGSAAGELDPLRNACAAAVKRLVGVDIDALCVVGSGPDTQGFAAGTAGSVAEYGFDRRVALGSAGDDTPTLPLSLTVGAYLLEGLSYRGVTGQAVAATAPPAECARLGALLATGRRLGLLVMGDGSARRTMESPGAFDPRAEPFDREVGGLLASADAAGLLGLDPVLADAVLAGGRAAWQVAAGAAGTQRLTGELLYAQAPYDVGYFVATWISP